MNAVIGAGAKISILFLAVAMAETTACATEIRLEGGRLELAGPVEAGTFWVEAGAVLQGAGSVSGSGLVAGRVSPGSDTTDVATLSFGGDLDFQTGSVFECHASSHEALDRLQAGGSARGACTVSLTRADDAVPLHQVIIAGGEESDYSMMYAVPSNWTLASIPVGDLEVTEQTGDSDADSLPDWWEYDYFLDRTGAEPDAHGDSDGVSNWQEWLAGTDPTNSDSLLTILSVAGPVPTRPVITWSGVADRTYSIYRASGASTNSYELIAAGIAGKPSANSYTDEVPSGAIRTFYQVRVQP